MSALEAGFVLKGTAMAVVKVRATVRARMVIIIVMMIMIWIRMTNRR